MYLAEKESGVHSTYYFRNCTLDTELINMMLNDGFEVGFHYETLANYVMSRNIAVLKDDDIEVARSLLKDEIKDFEKRINHKIVSAASHGHPANGLIGYSNNYLLEGQNNEDYGILFEAYDSDMYREYVKIHIMDAPVWMNYGFAYMDNPIDAINDGAEVIILLAHPNHWYGNKLRQAKDLTRLFLGTGKKYEVRKFKRIAINAKKC